MTKEKINYIYKSFVKDKGDYDFFFNIAISEGWEAFGDPIPITSGHTKTSCKGNPYSSDTVLFQRFRKLSTTPYCVFKNRPRNENKSEFEYRKEWGLTNEN